MSETMLAALIGAGAGVAASVIGGLLTIVGTRRQARNEQRARREKIATGLLWELRSAEYLLHRFARDVDNLTGSIRIPLFERVDPDVMLLSHVAVALVLDFRARVDEINGLRERAKDELPNQRRKRIRVKCVEAAKAVQPLRDELTKSGGRLPPSGDTSAVVHQWPPLPERAFGYGPELPVDREPAYWRGGALP